MEDSKPTDGQVTEYVKQVADLLEQGQSVQGRSLGYQVAEVIGKPGIAGLADCLSDENRGEKIAGVWLVDPDSVKAHRERMEQLGSKKHGMWAQPAGKQEPGNSSGSSDEKTPDPG